MKSKQADLGKDLDRQAAKLDAASTMTNMSGVDSAAPAKDILCREKAADSWAKERDTEASWNKADLAEKSDAKFEQARVNLKAVKNLAAGAKEQAGKSLAWEQKANDKLERKDSLEKVAESTLKATPQLASKEDALDGVKRIARSISDVARKSIEKKEAKGVEAQAIAKKADAKVAQPEAMAFKAESKPESKNKYASYQEAKACNKKACKKAATEDDLTEKLGEKAAFGSDKLDDKEDHKKHSHKNPANYSKKNTSHKAVEKPSAAHKKGGKK